MSLRGELEPERDSLFDTAKQGGGATFKKRRFTAGAHLDPIPIKRTDFLKKGQGNGGSPTNYITQEIRNENGQIQLEPIAKR